MISVINGPLCKGCGTCVAACPAQAISGAHFTSDQIVAELEGLLWDAKKGQRRPAGADQTVLEPVAVKA